MLKAKTDNYLARLFEKLVGPAADFIGDSDLVVAPVSLLHYLPFHAFRCGDRYLIEEREISYAPSGTVWSRLRSGLVANSAEALILGFADENVPLIEGEIGEVKKLFGNSTVLAGENATFDAYCRFAPSFDILHFACHGQFRPDNPSFSSLHLADGWVTVKDITSQGLKAGLVTLSACETGLNHIAHGEEIIGLARGFLSAGAASIVLSLWTVNDAATTRLMTDLYTNLQLGKSVPASLRIAQSKMIADRQHPFYWSPFMVIGK
jgi:CHAT domain-containing protein